jgi:hypothetical protein
MMRTQKHLPFLREQATRTLAYLKGAFKRIGMSESELKENAETMAHEMREHEDNMRRMTDRFKIAAAGVVDDILGDVRSCLSGRIDTYASLAISGSDAGTALNNDVRAAVNEIAKQRFESIAQKYAEDCAVELEEMAELQSNVGGLGIAGETEEEDDFLKSAAIGVGAGSLAAGGLWASGAALTAIIGGTIYIPVVGIVVAVVAGLVSWITANNAKEAKHREAMNEARRKIFSEVIPNVINSLRPQVTSAITAKTDDLCAEMEKRLAGLKTVNEKTLADISDRLDAANREKTENTERLEADIAQLETALAETQ